VSGIIRNSSDLGPDPNDIKAGLMKTFKEINEALFTSTIDILLSGSTCNIVFVVWDWVYTANVGDSWAVLYKDSDTYLIPIEISEDHKPSLEREWWRILEAGGRI